MRMLRVGVFCAVSFGAAVLAQVQVHQGTLASEDPKQFASPMVLDLPVHNFGLMRESQIVYFRDVTGYYCEDVTLQSLSMTRKRGTPAAPMRLDLAGVLFVRKSYDRFVTLNLSMRASEAVVATAKLDHVKVEEKKTRSFHVSLDLSPAQLAQLTTPGVAPQLRVSVIVASDR